MGLVVDVEHVLHGKLGVALRGGEALVSQHFLNGAQVGSFLEHVCPEGVAQSVRVDIGRKPLCDGNFLHNTANTPRGQPAATSTSKQRKSVFVQAGEQLLPRRQIGCQRT